MTSESDHAILWGVQTQRALADFGVAELLPSVDAVVTASLNESITCDGNSILNPGLRTLRNTCGCVPCACGRACHILPYNRRCWQRVVWTMWPTPNPSAIRPPSSTKSASTGSPRSIASAALRCLARSKRPAVCSHPLLRLSTVSGAHVPAWLPRVRALGQQDQHRVECSCRRVCTVHRAAAGLDAPQP